MPRPLTRIFSDVHYGDRASLVDNLTQLRPLTAGIDQLILNGDTLDTRAGPLPTHTQTCREEVQAFTARAPDATMLSGNHDPENAQHVAALRDGQVIVTHGDILFDDIVPWGRDANMIRSRLAAAVARRVPGRRLTLEERFSIWREVAATIPQRHQSERNRLKYAFRFAADTIWPPLRILRILRAWKLAPTIAARFAEEHWPGARFIVIGHTHRPGIWTNGKGPVVINTGSFCPPGGGLIVDVGRTQLHVRRVQRNGGGFHPGDTVATFSL